MASKSARNYPITGAGRGIGRGLSRLLLQHGHRVFLIDNNNEELHNTVTLLSQNYNTDQDFQAQSCNLRNLDDIKLAAKSAAQFFGGHLDCLVNSAVYTGGIGVKSLADLTLEDWNISIETNLTAPMLMSQACLPVLCQTDTRPTGGCIIHMSSTRALMSEQNNESYSTTKAGLLGLSQSMAVSLGSYGIRCNAILPGWINVSNECKKADQSGQRWEDGLSSIDHEWHVTGRVGKVEDVWKAVEYLVESDFVTGAEVVVDGGVTRKMLYPES